MAGSHILRNLHSLIRNSALSYLNEFVWQDIELTEEFKEAYSSYLEKTKYEIEYLGHTSVITSPSTKYIYVPNQWFVIASYAVEVYEELQRYKEYFKRIAQIKGRKLDGYAKQLRDNATIKDRNEFIECAKSIFSKFCHDQEMVEESATRLWRFVNDYSWWSGQKTIDRGDFYVSVILNMLNLVNVSQGYVADIVSAYASDSKLRNLVKTIDGFTLNMDDIEQEKRSSYLVPDEEIHSDNVVREQAVEYETIPKPEKVRIKISGSNTLKEINYKG